MSFRCESCSSSWQYAFRACPSCGGKVVRETRGQLVVKGVTQVFVPSLEHPIVPYFILLLKDGESNLSAVKSFQEYRIGDAYSPMPSPSGVSRVGVVGTGTMGLGIASLCVSSGLCVVMKSRSMEGGEKAAQGIRSMLAKTLDGTAVEKLFANITATDKYSDLASCDIVIESVSEIEDIKKQVFRELGDATPPKVILATNTSSLSVDSLAGVTKHPARVVGMHFFNPVSKMQLVEVISGAKTCAPSSEAAWNLAVFLGKTPIKVKDTPGFIVNRLLLPFLNDAVRLLEGGVASKEEIDSAVRLGLNHRLGPIELIDLIGIDVFVEILRELERQTGDKQYAPNALAVRYLEAGKLGRKTGEGFYTYVK